MRSVSGPKNRLVLAIVGIAVLIIAVWLGAGAYDLGTRWPSVAHLLPDPSRSIGDLIHAAPRWLLPAALVLSIVVLLWGLMVLVAQIPRKARTASLRLTGDDGTLLATLDPDVLGRALAERAQDVPGVTDCSVWVAGSSRQVWLQASAKISPEAEFVWTVAELRLRLAEDTTNALGNPPQQIDLLLRPTNVRSGVAQQKAVA